MSMARVYSLKVSITSGARYHLRVEVEVGAFYDLVVGAYMQMETGQQEKEKPAIRQ
jgi:hypothetical protein